MPRADVEASADLSGGVAETSELDDVLPHIREVTLLTTRLRRTEALAPQGRPGRCIIGSRSRTDSAEAVPILVPM
jgi:hypothetical protein